MNEERLPMKDPAEERERRFVPALEITTVVTWFKQIVGSGLDLHISSCFPVAIAVRTWE